MLKLPISIFSSFIVNNPFLWLEKELYHEGGLLTNLITRHVGTTLSVTSQKSENAFLLFITILRSRFKRWADGLNMAYNPIYFRRFSPAANNGKLCSIFAWGSSSTTVLREMLHHSTLDEVKDPRCGMWKKISMFTDSIKMHVVQMYPVACATWRKLPKCWPFDLILHGFYNCSVILHATRSDGRDRTLNL